MVLFSRVLVKKLLFLKSVNNNIVLKFALFILYLAGYTKIHYLVNKVITSNIGLKLNYPTNGNVEMLKF